MYSMPQNRVLQAALGHRPMLAKAGLTLDEERVCTEWAWDASGADLRAEGPKGTKAASSEASASLGALVGGDASLRAASVTLMKSRGHPSKLCRLQAHLCCHRAFHCHGTPAASWGCSGLSVSVMVGPVRVVPGCQNGGSSMALYIEGCRQEGMPPILPESRCRSMRDTRQNILTYSCAPDPGAAPPAWQQPLSGAPRRQLSALPETVALPAKTIAVDMEWQKTPSDGGDLHNVAPDLM